MVMLRAAWSKSFVLFIAMVVILGYSCNTVLVHYAPIIVDVIELLSMASSGGFDRVDFGANY